MTHKPPVLGIDCRFAALHTGIGRYVRALVPPLLDFLPPDLKIVLFVQSDTETWLTKLPRPAQLVVTDIRHYSLAEQILLPRLLEKHSVTHWFAPHFNVPVFNRLPLTVTIHDLILHRFPNHASILKRLIYKIVLGRAVRAAQSIIAVSEFTKSDLNAEYPAAASKVTVVSEAVEDHFQPQSGEAVKAALAKYNIATPYYLYVGNAKEHKNVPLLLKAFEQLQDCSTSLVLVSSGSEAATLPLPARTMLLQGVAEADLCALYTGAIAFVTPSLYEGFCLPLLEARACGCRVIAVGSSAIPETAGPEALLTEPTAAALAAAMTSLAGRPAPVRPQRTWRDVAADTAAVIAKQL